MPDRDWKRELTDIVRREMKEIPEAGGISGASESLEPAVSEAEDRFVYTVTADDGEMTVKQILKRRMGFSSRLLQKLKSGGKVMRNGVQVRLFADVIEGDVIRVQLPEERCSFLPEDIPICPVYEDEDLLVIDKQPGIVVHPTKGHPSGTIANGLMRYMERSGHSFKIRFVNRLDRDTSGLLIVAKNSHCQDSMMKQMKRNQVEKTYLAVVHGMIPEENSTVDLPIGRPQEDSVQRWVMEDGYPSVTHYRVLQRFAGKKTEEEPPSGFTFVRLKLETGRTHQIRVHMAYTGHPLVGDSLYGREEPQLIGRQALHAASLSFFQPVSGQKIVCEAPLPADMKKLIEKLSI